MNYRQRMEHEREVEELELRASNARGDADDAREELEELRAKIAEQASYEPTRGGVSLPNA